MKKEDLLLVFDFLATALKQDVVEESVKSLKSEKAIDYDFNDYDYEVKKSDPEPEEIKTDIEESKPKLTETKFNAEKWHEDFQEKNNSTEILTTDNKIVKHIKTEAVRVKKIMDMIDSGKIYRLKPKLSTAEDSINKVLKEHQQSIAAQLSALESKLRDSLATPEQRRLFREFVKMENFKANKDLNRIEYFLNNPGLENPYEGKEDDVKPNPIEKVNKDGSSYVDPKFSIEKSKSPKEIKTILTPEILKTLMGVTPGNGPTTVKFKEEYKHGLGPNKKFGFDGQEIKE